MLISVHIEVHITFLLVLFEDFPWWELHVITYNSIILEKSHPSTTRLLDGSIGFASDFSLRLELKPDDQKKISK